ncbi:MAG: IS21 family transposase [Clostridiales bacterium]|nr:IS21 family transposase [Clostridiales bacterium]
MKDKQEIILYYLREGMSIRAISRITGFHRKTVATYVNEYNKKKRQAISEGLISENEIHNDFLEAPCYDSSTRKPRKVTPEIEAEITSCIEENQKKRSRGEGKQQMNNVDIHEYLLSKGFDISYPTTCRQVKKLTPKHSETFIKQQYNPGSVCEFDWGEAKLQIADKSVKYNMAVFTAAYSGWVFACLFPYQKTRDFMESHAVFFAKIGGVHKQFVYDNMKTAVKRFVGRNEKEPTEALLKLSTFYGFDFRFCNIASGNEKGHVEGSVKYVRGKAFSRNNSFADLEEANHHLEKICNQLNAKPKAVKQGKTANELLQIARAYLFPVQSRIDCSDYRECRVDKLSTICVESCHYSVPENYNGKIVQAKITTDKVICFVDNRVICEHKKLRGKQEYSMQIEHYLKTLLRKPGAYKGSVAYQQMDETLKSIYRDHFPDNTKDFIRLMTYMKDQNISIYEIKAHVEKLENLSIRNVSLENIKALIERDIEPNQEYPCNNINEAANQQLQELSSLLPDANHIYEGGKIL